MELSIQLPKGDAKLGVTGTAERYLKLIRDSLGVQVQARQDQLRLSGESVAVGRAARVVEQLVAATRKGRAMTVQQVVEALANAQHTTRLEPSMEGLARHESHAAASPALLASRGPQLAAPVDPSGIERHANGESDSNGDAAGGGVSVPTFDVYLPGRRIKPATAGQQHYARAILQHDLTFCCGPAGTGKTYLAVAAAVDMLRRGRSRRLILTRPAVEAGERLGFLPGSLQEKVNPYLRPLLDALHDMMDFEQVQRFMAADVIEIVPLAFMRGRTLNDAVIILDEAQNTTRSQMLMFLTRLGHGSKMIVTGDTSQTDLPDPADSGLVDALRRLRRTSGVAMTTLEPGDIVRHSLVQRIVAAYEPAEARKGGKTAAKPESDADHAGEPDVGLSDG